MLYIEKIIIKIEQEEQNVEKTNPLHYFYINTSFVNRLWLRLR